MKTIIFDMYGVILKESKGNFIPYTYRHFPETDIGYLKTQFTRASMGEIDAAAFMTGLGFSDWRFNMADYIDNHLTFDTGFIDFVERAKGKYRFALLSNDVADWSCYITDKYQLNPWFDAKVISADVKCRKPDTAIYQRMLEALSSPAEDCIFIDNSVINLNAAAALGMDTVLFNRDGEDYRGKVIFGFDALDAVLSNLPY